VQTNQLFLLSVLADGRFASAAMTTEAIDAGAITLGAPPAQLAIAAALAAMASDHGAQASAELTGFTNALGLAFPVTLELSGERVEVLVEPSREPGVVFVRIGSERLRVSGLEQTRSSTLAVLGGVRQRFTHVWDGELCWLHAFGNTWRVRDLTRRPAQLGQAVSASGRATAPMDGVVIEVSVKAGQRVAAGDALAVLEAMKLERRVHAGLSGVVAAVHVSAGMHVREGALLVTIEAE
jgi:geranyl-CoA carboxylase alpha subunit